MKNVITYLLLLLLTACVPTPHDVRMAEVPLTMYPDYQDVTIPCNIAPLNFLLRGNYTAVNLRVEGKDHSIVEQSCRGAKLVFRKDVWQQIVSQNLNDSVGVTICAEKDGQWWQFPSFKWYISADSIDAYITYRLIEPGYEVWDKVCIEERCIENFETRLLADGNELGNRCMNCHTHGGDKGQYSFFHLRGEKGGTILHRDGKLRKVTLKTPEMKSGTVYGDWHPSGQYAVFSGNVIIPAFHTMKSRRLEVYDTMSDLCVADFDHNKILFPAVADDTSNSLETFPCFSADGRSIFFCSAPNPCGDTIPSARDLEDHIQELHYSLCRIDFNPENGSFGTEVDTIYNARLEGGSANYPKCSADGKYLCFTRSDHGTFPIWHQEATLCFIPLQDSIQTAAKTTLIDSQENGTYHTWSHNSKWLAFASKRADGQYGRVHFIHIGNEYNKSSLSKPLTLPQEDPEMDDWNLRSYNIPDLSTQSMSFGQKDIKTLLEQVPAEIFK